MTSVALMFRRWISTAVGGNVLEILSSNTPAVCLLAAALSVLASLSAASKLRESLISCYLWMARCASNSLRLLIYDEYLFLREQDKAFG
jgi:hypothetical protein